MGQLYTVGHSTYPEGHFIELIKKYEIDYILDVRSTPFSKYAPQYNMNILRTYLKRNKIGYYHMGQYFGARQDDPAFYNADGYLDFELFRESVYFKEGVMSVKKGLEDYNLALMCTEKNPIDCHRAIMVARGMELEGIDVKHILHDFTCIDQNELNQRLLDMYYPKRAQMTLFSFLNEDVDYLVEAYRKRNSDIGHRKNTDKEVKK